MTPFRAFATTLAAAGLLAGCATSSSIQQARNADGLRDFDLAVVAYTRALAAHPNDEEARLGLERARLRAAQEHYLQGRRLASIGNYEQALLELQVAVELNPSHGDAPGALRTVRLALRAQRTAPPSGQTELESVLASSHTLTAAGPVLPDRQLPGEIVTGSQASSAEVYLMIGAIADLSVTFDPAFRETPARVSLLNDMSLAEALDATARATGTFYQVTAPGTIIVVNDNPGKRREYLQEYERAFVVQNANMEETINALRIVSDMRMISPIPGTNMFVARDTEERLRAADLFVRAFDKARPEVVIDVEVLEVNRSTLREYGAQLASPGAQGISGAFDVNRQFLNLEDLGTLGRADVIASGIPALYYRLLKTDGQTRTLASPNIRIMDGIQGTAEFGQEIPVPNTVIQPITQGGLNIQPQVNYEYRNIGVNIGITPRTHPNDEITLGLSIELSTLAGVGFDGLPTFGSRRVETTIRLRDGETNILAGLIRDDERTTRETLPLIGDIPVIGQLFGRNRKDAEQTDVVIMLTPHIVRVLDVTEADLRPLLLPRSALGATVFETAPITPAEPIIRGGGGGGGIFPGGGGGTEADAPGSQPPAAIAPLPSFPVASGPPAGVLPEGGVSRPTPKVIKN